MIDAAVLSPYFLHFSPVLNAFEETLFHTALLNLRTEIRRFNECNSPDTMVVVYEHSPRQRFNREDTVAVEPNKLAGLLHLYDRWINIIELCIAIHRHLDGKSFAEPSLRNRSPVDGSTEQLGAGFPTVAETVLFINYDRGDKAAASE
jgi:hypothetical protein